MVEGELTTERSDRMATENRSWFYAQFPEQDGKLLTLTGSANVTVTGLKGNIVASNSGTLTVTTGSSMRGYSRTDRRE